VSLFYLQMMLGSWFHNPLQFKNILNEVYERDIGNVGTLNVSSDHTKFLGLTIGCSLTWERHIYDIKKLSSACYMIRNIKPLMSIKKHKTTHVYKYFESYIYNSYFHSVMTYDLIYWGNMSHAEMVFKM
jgi:hypothetical protein